MISALGKSHCDNKIDGFIKILSQNGKIVGAVTHVFTSDPTKGYGVYIDWML